MGQREDYLTAVEGLLNKAKSLAKEYRTMTNRPLGITGEIAEFSAAKILKMKLADVRQSGYDAIYKRNGKEIKVQIKGRCISAEAKPGQRLGGIKLDKTWDVVLLVILDEDYEVVSMYEAERPAIAAALRAPGSKARNERGALSVSKFKSLAGAPIWQRKSY